MMMMMLGCAAASVPWAQAPGGCGSCSWWDSRGLCDPGCGICPSCSCCEGGAGQRGRLCAGASSVHVSGAARLRSITFPSLPPSLLLLPGSRGRGMVPGLQPAGPRWVIMLLLIEDHLRLVI